MAENSSPPPSLSTSMSMHGAAQPLFALDDDPLRDGDDALNDGSFSDPLAGGGGGSGSGSGSDPLAAHGTAHGSLFADGESSSDNEDNPFSSKEDQTEQPSASGGATSTAAPNESAFASLALNDNPPMPVNDMQPPPAYETMQHASSSSSSSAAAAH